MTSVKCGTPPIGGRKFGLLSSSLVRCTGTSSSLHEVCRCIHHIQELYLQCIEDIFRKKNIYVILYNKRQRYYVYSKRKGDTGECKTNE
jgi:hypothetical protein